MPKDRNRLLNALFRDTPESIVIADANRRIVDINPASIREFGYTLEDLAGKSASLLYADQSAFERAGTDAFQNDPSTGTSSPLYFRYRRKDGTIFPARTMGGRLVDDDGRAVGFVGMIDDLTQLMEQAKAGSPAVAIELGASERALVDALFEKTPGMLHSCDIHGVISRVSAKWLDRFGFTADEVLGRCVWDFMTPDDAARSRASIEELWKVGSRHHLPYKFVTKDGEFVEVELSATLDTSDNRQRALVLLEDVTDRNQSMRALEDRNGQLREFARMAAHDLQTPLRHISLFAEMIIEETDSENANAAAEHAKDLQACAARLGGMVKGLLEFSLANEATVHAVDSDLDAIVARACKTLEHEIDAAGARITINALPAACCDPGLMERVFENLLSNALKYVRRGVPPRISVSASVQGGTIDIAVEDNGIGIAPQFRSRIFEPMRRLHGPESDYQGSGIGLALCKRIVLAHCGQVWVEDCSTGSRFIVRLPGRGVDRSSRVQRLAPQEEALSEEKQA